MEYPDPLYWCSGLHHVRRIHPGSRVNTLAVLVLLVFTVFMPTNVRATGILISQDGSFMYPLRVQTVVFRDDDFNNITEFLQVSGHSPEFAWIIPVEASAENLRVGPAETGTAADLEFLFFLTMPQSPGDDGDTADDPLPMDADMETIFPGTGPRIPCADILEIAVFNPGETGRLISYLADVNLPPGGELREWFKLSDWGFVVVYLAI